LLSAKQFQVTIVTVEIANAVEVVLVKCDVGFISSVERCHDGFLYIRMSESKRMTQLVNRYL